jgi:hypothetical protein
MAVDSIINKLVNELRRGEATILLKEDGIESSIKCTLNINMIPEEKRNGGSTGSSDVLAVWHIDKLDWHLIHRENIIGYSVTL